MAGKYDSMGFVTLEEIMNVFSFMSRELDQKLRASLPTIEQRGEMVRVTEFFEAIRAELGKRARSNLKAYLTQNPALKAEERAAQATATADTNRLNHEERVRRNRERARLGES